MNFKADYVYYDPESDYVYIARKSFATGYIILVHDDDITHIFL